MLDINKNQADNAETKIKKLLKEIMRHIVTHDSFQGIYFEQNVMNMHFVITCHCGKTWNLNQLDLIKADVESLQLKEYIEKLNSFEFFNWLKDIKESGVFEKEKKEELLEKTGSPTISLLEI